MKYSYYLDDTGSYQIPRSPQLMRCPTCDVVVAVAEVEEVDARLGRAVGQQVLVLLLLLALEVRSVGALHRHAQRTKPCAAVVTSFEASAA